MPERRPDILLLLVDQHRGDCLTSDGHPVLMTPNIDAIGGNGTRFTCAYSTTAVCHPARRSLLSGQFPDSHGARTNVDDWWEVEHTIGTLFRDAGYQTGWVGLTMHQHPPRRRLGFEEVVLSDYRIDDDYDAFMQRDLEEGGAGYYDSGILYNDWTARPFPHREELHMTNWTVHEAQRFLDRRDPTRPFCLVVSFTAPHPPLIPPAFYLERYLRTGVPDPHIGDWATPPAHGGIGAGPAGSSVDLKGEALLSARAGYYGLINHLDDQIHRLVNGQHRGVDPKETVILYTSDHGEMLGDHHMWKKSVPYEGSAHIPLQIRLPAEYSGPTGQVLDVPVCLEDILPTMLDVAGIDIPDSIDGMSLAGCLRGDPPPSSRVLHLQNAHGSKRLKHHTLTDGREKFIWFTDDGREQFFRLTDDPHELHDLSACPEEAERVDGWRHQLIQELTGCPEGFTDGRRLIPGRPFPPLRPTAGVADVDEPRR